METSLERRTGAESSLLSDEQLRILIIDDEEVFGQSLAVLLERRGATVTVATSSAAGLQALKAHQFDMVLLDHVLPDGHGLDLIPAILASRSEPLVLMMTAYGTVDDAVEAMRRGAHDYIAKSADVRNIVERVQQALGIILLRRRDVSGAGSQPPLLGVSPAMDEIRHRLRQVARSPTTTVLMTGESGTGKELAARTLHILGPQKEEPFIAVDCVAHPATLAESELFGHERGAFTGAERVRLGKLETAGRGTVLLDEVGDLDTGLQAKLVRVLENRMVTHLGGQTPIPIRARVVAATNSDLAGRVANGLFRLDLYHRLSVFQITMPPLRERREDINLLVEHFVNELALRLDCAPLPLNDEANELLRSYDYPGNVRELRNILEQALIMCEGQSIEATHLPERLRELQGVLPTSGSSNDPSSIMLEFVPFQDSLADAEERLIVEVLRRADGQVTKASQMLGISRFALSRRLEKYRIR